MKIVFPYARWTGEYGLFGHFAKRNSTWAPLNLALLGAVCEQAGHEVEILDGEAMGWDKERLARETLARKPDVIGITAYSPFFHLSADLAEAIKKQNRDIPIIGGGPHFTIMKEKAMLPQFDYGFLGEAEDSLPEFLKIADDGLWSGKSFIKDDQEKQLQKTRGIMYRQNGEIKSTGERWIKTESMTKKELSGAHPLDRLPLPARHLLPMEKYRLGTPNGRDYFTSLQTARGCPWT